MSTSHYDPSFNPPYEPDPPHAPADTPPGAEARLEAYKAALDQAAKALARARNAELDAEEVRDSAKRRAQLSEDCPKVGVFGGVRTTAAYAQAWIEEQIKDEERAYKQAKAARQAASDHLRKVGKQGGFQQSIAKSVTETYRGAGEAAVVGLAEVISAREEVIKAALDVLRAERNLSDESASATAVMDAEGRLALAAKTLTEVVSAASRAHQPRGWDS